MLNETNRELEERSDKAAADEMMIRTEVQIPAPLYRIHEDYMDRLIKEQQRIEAKEWKHSYGY